MQETWFSVHPVADASHRWVALSIEILAQSAEPLAPTSLASALAHWLDEGNLRASAELLPLVFPPVAAALDDAAFNALLASLPPGQAVVRLTDGPTTAGALDDCLGRGARVLLPAGSDAAGTGIFVQCESIDSIPPPPAAGRLSLLLGVDTPAQFTSAVAAGWQWLAGNYPLASSATTKAAEGAGSARATMLKLLGQIAADADDAQIGSTLKQDPQLSYQLLRLVNSVSFSLPTPITSFPQAIAMLGRRQLQRWLQLLLFAQRGNDDASPLLPRAAWRAALMENLQKVTGGDRNSQDAAFMAGMFSLLDVLLGQPIAKVIAPLNLDAPVSAALLERAGPLGNLLTVVELTERNNSVAALRADVAGAILPAFASAGLTQPMWLRAQADAAHWAVQISKEA